MDLHTVEILVINLCIKSLSIIYFTLKIYTASDVKYIFWAICLNINIWEIQTVPTSHERIKEKRWATNYIVGGRKKKGLNI